MTLNQKWGFYLSPIVAGGDEGMPSGYVDGCNAANTVILGVIQPGRCRSDDDTEDIVIPSQLTANITTTGAGGRNVDTAEQASTWYALCVIKNSASGAIAAFLINENDLATFTWPAGYDKKKRVGWLRNNAGSDLRLAYYLGKGKDKRVHYVTSRANLQALAGGSAVAFTDVDLSEWLPPGCYLGLLNVVFDPDGTSFVELRSKSAIPADPPNWMYQSAIGTSFLELGVNSDRLMQYSCNQATDNVDIYVRGYFDEL